MARWGTVVAVGAVALLAACSSSGDSAPAESITPATVATTTAAPTTTSAPPTTQAPTTTIDPAEALAAEVEADFLEADPARPARRRRTRSTPTREPQRWSVRLGVDRGELRQRKLAELARR